MFARCLPLYVLLAALVGAVPEAASAAMTRGAESVLVLGMQRAGKYDAKLTHALYEHLAKAGEALVKESALAAPERLCGNEECMSMLASREEAKVVLSGQVQDSSPTSQFVTVALFDVERRVPVDEKTICDHCSALQLQAAVWDLADRLLRSFRSRNSAGQPVAQSPVSPVAAGAAAQNSGSATSTAPATSGSAAEPSQPQPLAQPTTSEAPFASPNDPSGRWSPKRKVAAGVLTGLLIATLIPTLALHTTNGQETSIIGCASGAPFCVLQNRPLYTAGYVVSGVLALGLGLTLLWPTSKPAAANPAPSPSGAAALEGN